MIKSVTNEEMRQPLLQHAENLPRVLINEVSKLQAAAAEVRNNNQNYHLPTLVFLQPLCQLWMFAVERCQPIGTVRSLCLLMAVYQNR